MVAKVERDHVQIIDLTTDHYVSVRSRERFCEQFTGYVLMVNPPATANGREPGSQLQGGSQ